MGCFRWCWAVGCNRLLSVVLGCFLGCGAPREKFGALWVERDGWCLWAFIGVVSKEFRGEVFKKGGRGVTCMQTHELLGERGEIQSESRIFYFLLSFSLFDFKQSNNSTKIETECTNAKKVNFLYLEYDCIVLE